MIRKGVLAELPSGELLLRQWPIDREGRPHHLEGANAERLMDHALAFVTVAVGGTFDLYATTKGSRSRDELKAICTELDPRLTPRDSDGWSF